MGFWNMLLHPEHLVPSKMRIYEDDGVEKIEIVNNPKNEYAPAEVVRYAKDKKSGKMLFEMGSFDDFKETGRKMIEHNEGGYLDG